MVEPVNIGAGIKEIFVAIGIKRTCCIGGEGCCADAHTKERILRSVVEWVVPVPIDPILLVQLGGDAKVSNFVALAHGKIQSLNVGRNHPQVRIDSFVREKPSMPDDAKEEAVAGKYANVVLCIQVPNGATGGNDRCVFEALFGSLDHVVGKNWKLRRLDRFRCRRLGRK